MAKVIDSYTIELSRGEALAFKKLLGSMTDEQFSSHGVSGEDRELMSDVWNSLPFEDEELFKDT